MERVTSGVVREREGAGGMEGILLSSPHACVHMREQG